MPAHPRDPIFVFDSKERFLPMAVESVEAVPATLITAASETAGDVSLEALPAEGGRMNFPPDPESQETRLRDRFGGVGYRRELEAGGLVWIQYWLWYLYNPKLVYVTGNHEGDWEFVQVGYGGDVPVCMTTSRHQAGGARMWWEIEHRVGRPVIYVALGSHANFFTPQQDLTQFDDRCDGMGAVLDDLAWKPFGPWATWPGLWGNSTGEGRSPSSPGRQGARWNNPAAYHSQSRGER